MGRSPPSTSSDIFEVGVQAEDIWNAFEAAEEADSIDNHETIFGQDVNHSKQSSLDEVDLDVDVGNDSAHPQMSLCSTKGCVSTNSDIQLIDGDVICTKCNSIVNRFIDMGAEWRVYSNDSGKIDVNQNRCGMPVNSLFPNSNLGTTIGMGGYHAHKLRKYHMWNSMPYKDRSFYNIADYINSSAVKYDIPQCIINDAKLLYKQVAEQKLSRGDNRDGLIASSIYMSCKTHNSHRSAKEIATMFNVSVSTITRGCKRFHDLIRMNTECTTPEHFIHRYCAILDCEDLKDICIYSIGQIKKYYIATENNPSSVAAALIVLVLSLRNDNKRRVLTPDFVANKCQMSNVTIVKTEKKLYQYRGIILPDWFIYANDIV